MNELMIDGYKKQASTIMKASSKRSILRWAHLIFSVPIFGYVYSPFEEIPEYAPAVRYVFLPALVVTGLWLWKGHVVSRFFGGSATSQEAT